MLSELSQSVLQKQFSAMCCMPIYLSLQHQNKCTDSFTASEKQQLAKIAAENRKSEYILGRHALKEVLNKINQKTDTSEIKWPNAQCSLSHSHGYAVAISSLESKGLGLDLQLKKIPSLTMAERILSKKSFSYWQALPDEQKPQTLQRLWTVNEAVYKASPKPQPANFRHYIIDKPDSMQCNVHVESNNYDYSIYCLELPNGFISIALR